MGNWPTEHVTAAFFRQRVRTETEDEPRSKHSPGPQHMANLFSFSKRNCQEDLGRWIVICPREIWQEQQPECSNPLINFIWYYSFRYTVSVSDYTNARFIYLLLSLFFFIRSTVSPSPQGLWEIWSQITWKKRLPQNHQGKLEQKCRILYLEHLQCRTFIFLVIYFFSKLSASVLHLSWNPHQHRTLWKSCCVR